jgi:hypothetical protein
MKQPIEERLQASIKHDAVNGDNPERAVVGLQIQEAIYLTRTLRSELATLRAERDRLMEALDYIAHIGNYEASQRAIDALKG